MTSHPASTPPARAEPERAAVELIGFPMDRVSGSRDLDDRSEEGTVRQQLAAEVGRAVDLMVEVARLQEALAAARSHAAHLESELSRWQERADNEAIARARERAESHERERDLIRILHRQIIRAQAVDRWTVTIADASVCIPARDDGADEDADEDALDLS